MKMGMGKFGLKHALLIALAAAVIYGLVFGFNLNLSALNKEVNVNVGDKDSVATPGNQLSAGAEVAVGTPSLPQMGGPAGYSPSMNFGNL